MQPILKVQSLHKTYRVRVGLLKRKNVPVLTDISFGKTISRCRASRNRANFT